jgi:AraC-like DNA-binding protein
MSVQSVAPYQGDFVAWNGGCGFLGEGGGPPIAPHAHYAIQLVIGAPSGLRVQFGRQGPWQSCAAALVPSRATHSIDVTGCRWSAVLFVEPETPEGRALAARLQGQVEHLAGSALAGGVARLEQAWRIERRHDAVTAACQALVGDLSATAAREPSDPRVLAAIDTIRKRLDDVPSLDEVAATVHLSPSRFRHLFVEQTGMPMRTYVLWRRVLRVWELLMRGETLLAAAHAAGFADSAHLSRTARTMFGLPPSVLQMKGPLSTQKASAPPLHCG